MKRKFFFLIFSIATIISSAQKKEVISLKDSIELNKSLRFLITAIQKHDSISIKSISLPILHCPICNSGFPEKLEFQFDDFVKVLFTYNFLQRIFDDYKSDQFFYYINKVKDLSIPYLKNIKIDELIIYEIFFDILNPNEFAPGHEGAQFLFQFIKSNNRFVLFGMMTIP